MTISRAARRFESERSVFFIASNPHDLYQAASTNFEAIGSTGELGAVAEGSAWQDFERLAAFIFEKNGFEVSVGTVKTRNRQRRQYDVIARKNNQTFLVECKKWAGSRYRLSALKRAVGQHRERTSFFEEVMREDAIPVIATLIEEEIHVYEGVPLVPIHLLNSFIRGLDNHADRNSFSVYEEELPETEAFPEENEFSGPGF